jgi:hypothetical protein
MSSSSAQYHIHSMKYQSKSNHNHHNYCNYYHFIQPKFLIIICSMINLILFIDRGIIPG